MKGHIVMWILLIATISIPPAMTIVCLEGACDNAKCEPISQCPKNNIRDGGFCSCCKICVKYLNEGEQCLLPILLGVPPPEEECGPGLICNETTHLCTRITRPAN